MILSDRTASFTYIDDNNIALDINNELLKSIFLKIFDNLQN